jgi:hypothetical protein
MQNKKSLAEQVADYLRKAEEAEAKARATEDPIVKKSFEATAFSWRRLAAFVDPEWKRQ